MAQIGTRTYYPLPGNDQWERREPGDLGMDADRLRAAVEYANAHESSLDRDIPAVLQNDPINDHHDNEIIGPVKSRTGVNGVILRDGYIVAEWGDTKRVDMTFSVAKSYLATLAGIAFDKGIIRDVNDFVGDSVVDGGFDSPHNAKITWQHLFQQASEWEGVLWDKPDTADRRRGRDRQLQEPGTFYEYNDVRVNRTALCLLRVLRTPLPRVLRDEIMDPIGASVTWDWHGYRNSWVTINGLRMQSVSGGSHWGGGIWASTFDHARFGYLYLRRGRWEDPATGAQKQLISEQWIDMMRTPSEQHPGYGYMWWLNTNRELFPSAPETSFFAIGKGANIIWIDPDHDIVAVVRWIERDHVDGFVQRVLDAVGS